MNLLQASLLDLSRFVIGPDENLKRVEFKNEKILFSFFQLAGAGNNATSCL